MSFGNLLKNIGKGLGNLQKQNRDNANEQTAHGSVFDKIKDALDKMKENAASTNKSHPSDESAPVTERKNMEPIDMLKKKIEEVKSENAADPNVPTAEESVFDRMKRMIEEQQQAEASTYNAPPATPAPTPTPTPTPTPPVAEAMGSFALTNSMGGSLSIRQNPDMGSPSSTIRIPEMSKVRVLEYSEDKINIDGQDSRWAKVDFNGTVGWVLEVYLNFN